MRLVGLRLSEIVGWLGISLGVFALFRIGSTEGPMPLLVLGAVATATAALVFWRSLASLTRLQALLVEGRPKPMLRIIKRRLRYRGGGHNRAPLLIYQAAAFSMTGDFEKGLAALDSVELDDDLEAGERKSWEFSRDSTRFACLLFAEKIEEARALYDDVFAPLEKNEALETTIAAMEGQLHYCEGEHIKAERIFEEIIEDAAVPPVSRAVFHYFLGRIYADRGQSDRADEAFDKARALAPKTWIPAGIEALEGE